MQLSAKHVIVITILAAVLGASVPCRALNLVSEYSIKLDENDRVLGSLDENYLIYGRPQITLYNSRGKSIFSRKLTNNVKPTLSPSGKYLGLVTYADHSPTDLKTVRLELFDQAGKQLWKMPDPPPNTFFITDRGTIFGVEGVKGIPPTRLYLYNQHGTQLNVLVIKEYHGLEIAPSAGKFIINKAREGLDVYDSLGNLLATLPVSEMYIFDRDDRYIGTFYEGLFRLYQDEREVATITCAENTLRAMATNVAKNIFVAMGPKKLQVFELTTQKLLWEYPLQAEALSYSSLSLSPDGQFIACGIDVNGGTLVPKERRHVEGYVYVFPTNGQTMISRHETYSRWGIGLPRAVFSASGGGVVVETREKIEKFRLR
jgi:hypothetical protein